MISVNPSATEICADDLDNNCDGDVDENCEIIFQKERTTEIHDGFIVEIIGVSNQCKAIFNIDNGGEFPIEPGETWGEREYILYYHGCQDKDIDVALYTIISN